MSKIFTNKLKIGDNVICKHNFTLDGKRFTKNNSYILTEKDAQNIEYCKHTDWDWYLQSLKQERKEKLKKLYESNM